MKSIIIVAMTRDRVIGKDGRLPWHVPEDLKFFKRTTEGHAVIMGRRTYDSMGRPLPRRRNIVITRQTGYAPRYLPDIQSDPMLTVLFAAKDSAARRDADQTCLDVVHSLPDAFDLCRRRGEEKAFVIGGGQVYQEAIDVVDELIVTHLDLEGIEGDTWFPEIHAEAWVDKGEIDPTFSSARLYGRIQPEHA